MAPETAGGGGTTAALPSEGCPRDNIFCSDKANLGAGAITSLWPMLKSPNLRVVAAFTSGGGATTAPSRLTARFICELLTCGAGATTSVVKKGSFKSAAGREVAETGTDGAACDHATTFGNGTSCFN